MFQYDTCEHQPFINRPFAVKPQHYSKCKKRLSHLREFDV